MAVKISGVSDLAKAMGAIKVEAQQKVGKRMVASAAGIIKKQAKSNVQSKGLVQSRALLNNIVIKQEKKAPIGSIQYNVGVRHGRHLTRKQKSATTLTKRGSRIVKRYVNDPFYWRFLEFKTVRRAATSFLAQAAIQKQMDAIDQMRKVADKELLKARL